jgi:uncharacterized protein (DUF302 family)
MQATMQALFHALRRVLVRGALACCIAGTGAALADNPTPYPGTEVVKTTMDFQGLWDKLKLAVKANEMAVVAQACGSCGAAKRGVLIPGNAVVMVYRNDFAVRMLEASVPAGIEAPLRFYVTENADGTASLTYRLPSAVFAPYQNSDIDALARELDAVWEKIVADTVN